MSTQCHHISFAGYSINGCLLAIILFMVFLPIHSIAAVYSDNHNEAEPSVQISVNGDETDGALSAYSEYTFSYSADMKVTNPQWSFRLEKTTGDYEPVAQSTDHTFTIPVIENFDGCQISADGLVNGLVTFECVADGKPYAPTDCAVRIDLKPVIKEIHNLTVVARDRYRDLSCDIEYSGADYVTAALEVDQSPSLRTEYIYEPGYAHLSIPGFSLSHDAWLDITVRNKYGIVTETIDLPASFTTGGSAEAVAIKADVTERIQVYTPGGIYMGLFGSEDQLTGNLLPGIYLIRAAESASSSIRKIAIQ